jgi:hypothetical protein
MLAGVYIGEKGGNKRVVAIYRFLNIFLLFLTHKVPFIFDAAPARYIDMTIPFELLYTVNTQVGFLRSRAASHTETIYEAQHQMVAYIKSQSHQHLIINNEAIYTYFSFPFRIECCCCF